MGYNPKPTGQKMGEVIGSAQESKTELVILNHQVSEGVYALNVSVLDAIKALREENITALTEALENIFEAGQEVARSSGCMSRKFDELTTTLASAHEICVKSAKRGPYKK